VAFFALAAFGYIGNPSRKSARLTKQGLVDEIADLVRGLTQVGSVRTKAESGKLGMSEYIEELNWMA